MLGSLIVLLVLYENLLLTDELELPEVECGDALRVVRLVRSNVHGRFRLDMLELRPRIRDSLFNRFSCACVLWS
jgi:hypothetical protein